MSTPDSPNDLAAHIADGVWEYAHRVVRDEQLVVDLGFANKGSIGDVVIAISAGDRLHPTKGLDYLGSDWKKENRNRILAQLAERDRDVGKIRQAVLSRLESDGYDSARALAIESSPFQVVYLSKAKTETKQNLESLLSLGLGTNELSDNMLEKRGSTLVIGYSEVISYFEMD